MDEEAQFRDWQSNHLGLPGGERRLHRLCEVGNSHALAYVKRREAAAPTPGAASSFRWGEPRVAVDSALGADKQPYSGLGGRA